MTKLYPLLFLLLCMETTAQKNLSSDIIEGGRVFVDFLRVLKSPKSSFAPANNQVLPIAADSCAIKSLADICYKNNTGKSIYISLYKRNGNMYTTIPLNLTLLNNSKECLFEIQAGIYKYKIEYENEDEKRIVFKEGEIKITSCNNRLEEVR